jgi:hypothetical protein
LANPFARRRFLHVAWIESFKLFDFGLGERIML